MRADFDGAVELARAAARFDWLWTPANIEAFGRVAGWATLPPDRRRLRFRTNLAVNRTAVRPDIDWDLFGRSSGRGDILQLSVRTTDVAIDAGPAQIPVIARRYAELGERLVREFGAPVAGCGASEAELAWSFPNLVVAIRARSSCVTLNLVNPIYQQWLKSDSQYHRKLEDGYYDHQ